MAKKKLSEELRRCLEDDVCGDCQYHKPETKFICKGLLQKAYERVKEYEKMEDRENISKLSRNIPQELSYIKQLANSCENEASKNNIIVACDSVLKMCNDTFNGYCRENLELYRRLQKYEDLEEQGKLLKLPCAVGDTLYSVSYKRKCREYGELIGGNMECFGCREDCGTKEEYFIKEVKANLAIIGNLIEKPEGFLTFLTLQEAEQALKEMEGGGRNDNRRN